MASNVKLGLELILGPRAKILAGQRVGLIVNPTSVDSNLEHAADLFHKHPGMNLRALFGPQHGFRGETQDNMIEWQSFEDARLRSRVYSLYGEARKPSAEMLSDIDVLVFDIQDVGTRVYTFIYTMALAMQSAGECGKRFVVLDRPNPISGARTEGNVLDPEFASFVGMYPIPMRHGMTAGELASMFNNEFAIGCDLEVVSMEGWHRPMWYDHTALPWVMPSPNMPTLETATVYPGTVMIEGTNISEGRGTTRPFEMVGAPFIDGQPLVELLASYELPGLAFRAVHFQPTFHKHAGELCGGVQIHVTDRLSFKPVITGIALITAIRTLYPRAFAWKQPPYEYVYDKLPFDVIAGTSELRGQMEAGIALERVEEDWEGALITFEERRSRYILYD